MRYRVLGAVELVGADGQVRPISSPNQRTVLAVLLAAGGDVVTLDALVEAVWPGAAPPTAVSTLRTYISRLRAQVGAALASRGGGYALDVPPGDLDAARFEAAFEEARHADAVVAADLLAAALDLWQGAAFGDCADLDGVRAEARRLEQLRTGARERYAAVLLGAGRVDEAVAAAEALVTVEPLHEGGWAVLIEALAGAQRLADALRAFRGASAALAEAGLEPSRRLRDTERLALSDDGAPSLPSPDGPPSVAAPHRFKPPLVPSSFVGRDDDRELLVELLGHTRLVTLTGPGGVGKTRLALEVARRAAERSELGACVVELASVADPAAVADLVVATLGVTADGRPAPDIVSMIGNLDVLIVLDNAEHVIDAAAATVARILAGGDAAHVLVTSREPLALAGEHVWTVAPLAIAGAHAPASTLFRHRAAALGAAPDDDVAMRIVRRLDGLPLAIEMAAAQLDTATADELAHILEERLDELRASRRQVPARHRSLHDLLAWSEQRLDDTEAQTLAAMSVFAGPVVAADVVGVLGGPGVLDVVRTLARRSLVSVDRTASMVRFHLLETIRSFARQRLATAGRAEQLSRRHAEWFAGVARSADAQLRTDEEATAQARLESVLAELRAAHRWSLEHDVDLAAALAAHVHTYARSRFVDEALLWGEQLLDRVAADHPHRPVLLVSAAKRLLRQGKTAGARHLAAEAAALAGDTPAALPALDLLTDAALFDGQVDDIAEGATRRMMAIARRHGDLHYLSIAYSGAALVAAYGGHPDPEALSAFDELDDQPLPPSGRGWLAYTRGEVGQHQHPQQALAHFDEAVTQARKVNNPYLEGAAIVSYCSLHARVGDPGEALRAFADAVRLWNRVVNTPGQLTTLRNLAVLFQRVDAAEPLAELLGAVDRAETPTYGEEEQRLDEARSWARNRLGPARFDELTAAGTTHTIVAAANAALRAIDALLSAPRGRPSAATLR